ncbi:MAG: hypothetical protein IKX22_08565 [Prevotella sp.]|nr:hypothetical protein [Prevotella sp.]
MKTEFVKNNKIKTFKDWEKYAAPKGKDRQWVKGRSAWHMADFAINQNNIFNGVITEILKECGIEIQDFHCEPEATAGLGKGMKTGGPRNHDLLMVGTKNCVIGVEAKVSETFDLNFIDVYKEQGGNNNTRAFALKEFLTPGNNVDEIGYQLFTATRGAMISAMKAGYRNAILLIIVFVGEITLNRGETTESYDKVIKKNDEDFCKFLNNIGANDQGMIQRKIEGEDFFCWVKKIKISIPEYTRVQ